MNERNLMYWRVVDALSSSGVPVYCIDGHNPYDIVAGSLRLRIHVSAVHDAHRRKPDEARIQCRGQLPSIMRDAHAEGIQPVVLGYALESGVFCAWDPVEFVARSDEAGRFSLYTRWSIVQRAAKRGLAVYEDNNGQRVLSFDQDALFGYCAAASVAHRSVDLRLVGAMYELFTSALGGPGDVPPEPPGALSRIRKKVTTVTTGYARDPKFPKLVLPAYGWRCAICGVQLGLVDAAHIVPHGHPKGIADVRNGVALCKLHHAAYDSSLLFIDETYRVRMNEARIEALVVEERTEGLDEFALVDRAKIALPRRVSQHPDRKLIRLANELRCSFGLKGATEE